MLKVWGGPIVGMITRVPTPITAQSRAHLEPYLHLGLGQLERVAELGPLRNGQVLLLLELPLQGHQLLCAERGTGLSIQLVFPEHALGYRVHGREVSCDW